MHTMLALVKVDPDKARKRIIDAFVKGEAHYQRAAALLDCHHHSYTRWAEMLGIKKELEKLEAKAEKEGWHHGVHGGAQFHKEAGAQVKAARTRKKNKKKLAKS